jgi:hypothetical protein
VLPPRSFGRPLSALATALLVSCSAAPALSADAPADARAEQLFREGRAALARGDHAEACARFAESQRLDPAPGTLLNLGECSQHLGLYASAFAHYSAAAALLGGDTRLAIAKQKLAEIEPQLSRLTVVLAPGAPAGTKVTRDEHTLAEAELGVAARLDRGEHRVVVRAPGREARAFTVLLPTAESRTLLVEPGAPLSADDARSKGAGLRTAGVIVGAAGLAGVGLGIGAGVLTIQRKDTVDAHCVAQRCDAEGVRAASQGKTWSAVSTAGFVAGLAGLGAGVVMVVVGGPRETTKTSLDLGVSVGLGGLVAQGRF